MPKTTYKESGVDLDVYRESMSRLPRLLKRTHSPRVLGGDGEFAGLFSLDFQGGLFARNYVDPVLVSATDGVGTKLKVAQTMGNHGSIGIDLVAMCVNDALCCGAEPLFFLDYVAMAKDDPQLLEEIVGGISEGCLQSEMALIGGETAIMPDVYQSGDYDLAGFCVGVVERSKLLNGSHVVPGDTVIGIASSGLHSNGYSLARKIVFDVAKLDVDSHVPECDSTVGSLLIEPTRIYVDAIRKVTGRYKVKGVIRSIAHITGGGLHENLARSLNSSVDAAIQRGSWEIPSLFPWLQQLGEVDDDEMFRVFNMGIGLVLVVSDYYADSVREQLAASGHANWKIGTIECGQGNSRWS